MRSRTSNSRTMPGTRDPRSLQKRLTSLLQADSASNAKRSRKLRPWHRIQQSQIQWFQRRLLRSSLRHSTRKTLQSFLPSWPAPRRSPSDVVTSGTICPGSTTDRRDRWNAYIQARRDGLCHRVRIFRHAPGLPRGRQRPRCLLASSQHRQRYLAGRLEYSRLKLAAAAVLFPASHDASR